MPWNFKILLPCDNLGIPVGLPPYLPLELSFAWCAPAAAVPSYVADCCLSELITEKPSSENF